MTHFLLERVDGEGRKELFSGFLILLPGFIEIRPPPCFLEKNTGAVAECCPLTGTWVTESGTYIELKHSADGILTGKYYDISTEGTKMETINGKAGKGKPTTFGFVVSLKVILLLLEGNFRVFCVDYFSRSRRSMTVTIETQT